MCVVDNMINRNKKKKMESDSLSDCKMSGLWFSKLINNWLVD